MITFVDIFAWLGTLLCITGGVKFYAAFSFKPAMVEINQWGLCFAPLLLAFIISPEKARDTSFIKIATAIGSKLNSRGKLPWILVGFGLLHFYVMFQRYMSFVANWDLAIYANACANGLHSSLRNNLSILADHFEPGLLLAAPLCRVGDPAIMLLMTQAIAWCIGAWGIHKLAVKMNWSEGTALAITTLYLLFAGHQTISYYDFHLYGWSLATIPWIMYAIQTNRTFLLAILILAHLTLKEHTGLFIAGLGVWLFAHNRKKTGVLTTLVGLLCFVVVMKYVFPHFRGGIDSEYFAKYYGYIGNTFPEFIKNSLTKPWIPFGTLLRPDRLEYYWILIAPFICLPLLAPSMLIPITGVLLVNALSSADFLYSGSYHYEAEIYPWFFAACIVAAKDPRIAARWDRIVKTLRYPRPIKLELAWLAILMSSSSGVTPFGQAVYYAPSKPQATMHTELRKIASDLHDCKISTVDRITPHLADVPQVLTIDHMNEADAVVIGYPQGDRLWMMGVDEIETKLVPKLNQNFKMTRPLNYDSSFRIWVKDPCKSRS